MLDLEIAYASPTQQTLKKIRLPRGSTIEQAILASGILEDYPEINLAFNPVGIFSEKKQLNDFPNSGDRIEIYRPLAIDPNVARQKRAKKARILARCKK